MKTQKKGLQKFTISHRKINRVLSLKKIQSKDINNFNPAEKIEFQDQLTAKLNSLTGDERDEFLEKIDDIIAPITRRQFWESNHIDITNEITLFIQDYGRMPSKTEISQKTGLSRVTVHKHLKEYITHPIYLEQLEQFKFMNAKLLAKVFQFALRGDIQAAKLFFSITSGGHKEQPKTLVENQNNYIQINGLVINQEQVKDLTPTQIMQLENVFNKK